MKTDIGDWELSVSVCFFLLRPGWIQGPQKGGRWLSIPRFPWARCPDPWTITRVSLVLEVFVHVYLYEYRLYKCSNMVLSVTHASLLKASLRTWPRSEEQSEPKELNCTLSALPPLFIAVYSAWHLGEWGNQLDFSCMLLGRSCIAWLTAKSSGWQMQRTSCHSGCCCSAEWKGNRVFPS